MTVGEYAGKVQFTLHRAANHFQAHNSSWVKELWALDFNGNPCATTSPNACNWCMIGMLEYFARSEPVFDGAVRVVSETLFGWPTKATKVAQLTEWQDKPDRTVKQVISLLRSAERKCYTYREWDDAVVKAAA